MQMGAFLRKRALARVPTRSSAASGWVAFPKTRRPAQGAGRDDAGTRCSVEIEEALELLRARGVPELAERLGLNLTNALTGDVEVLADLF